MVSRQEMQSLPTPHEMASLSVMGDGNALKPPGVESICYIHQAIWPHLLAGEFSHILALVERDVYMSASVSVTHARSHCTRSTGKRKVRTGRPGPGLRDRHPYL